MILDFLDMVYSSVDDENLLEEDKWAPTILTGDFFCSNWCKVKRFSGEKQTARTASFSEVCNFKSNTLWLCLVQSLLYLGDGH